jgi:hypothetical protein
MNRQHVRTAGIGDGQGGLSGGRGNRGVGVVRQGQQQGWKVGQRQGRQEQEMLSDEAGLGLHFLKSLVTRNHACRRPFPAFHLVQNSLRRLSVSYQLGDAVLGDAPCLPFGRKDRVPCFYQVKLSVP